MAKNSALNVDITPAGSAVITFPTSSGTLDTVLAATPLSAESYSGTTTVGTGGETINYAELVMLDDADSEWKKVDISITTALATGNARGLIGIAVTPSTDGAAITVLLQGKIRSATYFPSLSTIIGQPVYASTLADIAIAQPSTAGYIIRVVGFALTASEIWFNPSPDYITHS